MQLRVLNIVFLLIKASITDSRRLILHYIGIVVFFMAAVFHSNHSKWRVGPKILSVKILILDRGGGGGPITNILSLPEGP